MNGPTSLNTLQRRANIGLIAAFFVFLCLPTVDSFLRLDRAAAINENRALAEFPAFHANLDGLGKYLSGLESYFNDHFGFRKRLVRWDQHWKRQIFRVSKYNNALVGKDGWLFYTAGLMIDDVMGNRPFSESELEDWRQLLTHRRDWLAARGIRYLFVIPPDKHTIYPECLPEWLAGAARPPQRIEQFVNYMKAHSDLPIVDLRPALMDAKKDFRLYFQTDTHWNYMGGYFAYRRIMEELASLGLPVRPLDLSAFEVSTADLPAGDLARTLGQENSRTDPGVAILNPKPPLDPVLSRADPSLLERKWIPGTEPQVTENPKKTGKLLIFRDSFAWNLMPYLGHHFGRVVYLWQTNWNKGFIESEKPDVVIDEMLERFVITRNPAELRAADEAPDSQLVNKL